MSSGQLQRDRAERERHAYDEGGVWEHNNRWQSRFIHVFECPNTRRHEALLQDLMRDAVIGKRALELGCGDGQSAAAVSSLGASYVHGIDVAESFVERARARAIPNRIEFSVGDATGTMPGQFDLIYGRSVLHHIDYRAALPRLYRDTLRPGGSMIFMEPLGANPAIWLYTKLAPRAHTPDEASFRSSDLRWFRREFADFTMHPFNLASLYAGIISSVALRSADNAMLRLADRVDVWLAERARWLWPQFRHAVFVIRKPRDG